MENQTKEVTSRPTTASTKKDNAIKIKIQNSYITIGETYEVSPKIDRGAPDGMQEKETTKFLNEGNKEIRSVYYDETRRAWDTAFYPESNCLKGTMTTDEDVKLYVKYIKLPYEKAFNVDCSETNNEFWDSYRYELKTFDSFDTSDPKARFDLFHALTKARICEVGEKDSVLQKANYTIKNIEAVKSTEDLRIEDKFTAAGDFATLLTGDREKLNSILEWIQMSDVSTMDDKVLRSTFLRSFDNPKTGYDFARRFLEGLKMYDNENGKKQMEFFRITQKLVVKNKIDKKLGQLYLDGMSLGNTVKEISLKALTQPDLADMLYKAYEKHFAE